MSQAAYDINGQQVERTVFYEVACDPQRSVVVEACAGAGKTWMLVSRILRALLDGVPAHQILAITFTKKAAGEMRERLHSWLREFASADPAKLAQELAIRGVPAAQRDALVPRLAALHSEWLDAGRGVDIHTIHGWFSRLVKAAPLDILNELQLPPELKLIEDPSVLWPELWGRFLRRVDSLAQAKQPDGEARPAELVAFLSLVDELGRNSLEGWLQTALSNRLEVTLADQAGRLEEGVPSAAQWDPRWAGLADPTDAVLNDSVRERLWALARQLGAAKGALAVKAAAEVERALGLPGATAQARALTAALMTKDGSPKKKLGDAAELPWAQDWLLDLQRAMAQEAAHGLHQRMACLSRLLFAEYAKLKAERGQADMVDLELAAARLLGDPTLSGWIQERLDSQVRHLLMDEFQDTSPLQWQTLKSWLSAYAGAGGGHSGQQPIQVFLVGDPKQSIYRFRRADPRVFEAAKGFVMDALDGVLLACDHTRRNAPGVVDALNRVMAQAHEEGAFPGFRTHTTESTDAAHLRVLPSVMQADAPKPELRDGWRDSLLTPRWQTSLSTRDIEAAQVARAVSSLIANEGLQPDDIYVLARKRATLSLVAQALDAQGVPHIAPEDTLLIDTPEVRDLVAVLDVLVSPQHDLALAHALKSPLFGASDAELMDLARRVDRRSWWDTLMHWADEAARPIDIGVPPAAPAPSLQRAATLLTQWQNLAHTAPPHDLLERIVTDGDLRARLVAAVPPSQRTQSLSHVDALLTQSLAMDSGRDATPYRWVRALKRLPLGLPPRVQTGAVQLLTIHGAKGLEAKVVFLVDMDAQASKSDSYSLLVDWPDTEPRPLCCAFVQSESRPPPSLATALQEDKLADQREELNALYVALTRAREQLVFSRTEPRHANDGSWWQRLARSGAIDPEQVWTLPDAATQSPAEQGATTAATATSSHALPVLPTLKARPLPPQRSPRPPVSAEQSELQLLGQTIHLALEWLTTLPLAQRTPTQVLQAIDRAAVKLALPPSSLPQAHERVGAILHSPALQAWLDPAQLAWAGNEVALDHEGQSLRIDRLVARHTPEGRHWWVLDYKLSHRPQDLTVYRAQMARYVKAVSALQQGERVSAALVNGLGELLVLDDLA